MHESPFAKQGFLSWMRRYPDIVYSLSHWKARKKGHTVMVCPKLKTELGFYCVAARFFANCAFLRAAAFLWIMRFAAA
jgi:hypothetical protein